MLELNSKIERWKTDPANQDHVFYAGVTFAVATLSCPRTIARSAQRCYHVATAAGRQPHWNGMRHRCRWDQLRNKKVVPMAADVVVAVAGTAARASSHCSYCCCHDGNAQMDSACYGVFG